MENSKKCILNVAKILLNKCEKIINGHEIIFSLISGRNPRS